LTDSGTCTGSAAKAILRLVIETSESPDEILKKQGLTIISDTGEIESLCRAAIDANPGPVADYKAGKKSALQFLMGQVMKGSRGKANPKVVMEVLSRLMG